MPSGVPDGAAIQDRTAEIADRDYLLRALAALPAGQRAVLVLRYFDDLSEGETAAMLGCSVGSVKSQTARALAKLRASAAPTASNGLTKARAARRRPRDVAEVGVDG
jgi:DNA-directed RNA polymerase specialized sigma24 family protein